MNSIARNSLIASAVLTVVYVFNYLNPSSLLYSLAVATVMIFAISRYIFQIELSYSDLRENAKFVFMFLIYVLSSLSYLSYIYMDVTRAILTLFAVSLLYYLLISLRRVKNLGERASVFYRNLLVSTSFLALFMALSTALRLMVLLSANNLETWGRLLVVGAVFLLVYFFTYFLSWENGALNSRYRLYGLVSALLCGELAWITSIWVVNYPVIGVEEKASLGGTPLPAILITIVYYFLWGLLYHKLEKNLTRKVLVEYLSFGALFLAILLSTAKWLPLG
jgi:hypothetical protein